MDEEFLKLTNAVYKVLEFFPELDPLKNRAKEKALAIMDNGGKNKANLLEDIDMLLGYLLIAKSQGWLSSVNFMIISNEYEKIKNQKEKISNIKENPSERKISARKSPPVYEVTERQRKILDFLTKNEKGQVMDLQTILSNVTKRTIRRDLDELIEHGKITRFGEFNQVFYRIKG